MPAQFILAVNPVVFALHQEGLLERAFHDGLVPQLQFRAEAFREEAEAQMGTSITMTRRGLLPTITRPRRATDGDPQPQVLGYEQWTSTLQRYNGAIDTSMTEAGHQLASILGSNLHALGVQCGMSINLIARNGLYKPYLSGHTVLITAAAAADTTIRVASLNGFREVLIFGQNVRPQPVSAALPLPITINGVIPRNVIAAQPDDPNDPDGPGTLTLSAAVGSIVAVRAPVLSFDRPRIIRAGGGTTVDAIGGSDIATFQDFLNATTVLRNNKVPPHEDGFYHAQIPPDAVAQVFADPAFQRLNTALPDGERYQALFLGTLGGIKFYSNTECPTLSNAGDVYDTGTNAKLSIDIGAETINEGGTPIGRCIVTGRGAIYERWFDPKKYMSTEAGMNGAQGDFAIVNNGITIDCEGARLVIRSPIDRLQDVVSGAWDFVADFPAPSDAGSGGPEKLKRAVAIEFALG